MSRKMASIATISELRPIEGRDRVVLATFEENGYNVICTRDFKVGERVVYIEVDSILPQIGCFEFLRKNSFSKKCNGFRIRNMKMCGLYSNGIIFHTSDLPIKLGMFRHEWKSGHDLTTALNIGKYEDFDDASPAPEGCRREGRIHRAIRTFMMSSLLFRPLGRKLFLRSVKRGGSFPTDVIPKSDEDNIQNNKAWFDRYKDIYGYATFKMEGKSVTLCNHRDRGVLVFGRNSEICKPDELSYLKPLAERLKLISDATGRFYAVQGELVGPGIQSNIYHLPSLQFMVYKVVDDTDHRPLSFNELVLFCGDNDFTMVPVYFAYKKFGDLYTDIGAMQNAVEHLWFKVDGTPGASNACDDPVVSAIGMSCSMVPHDTLHKPEYHRHEGLVFRGIDNEFSFKVKSNEYQLEGL